MSAKVWKSYLSHRQENQCEMLRQLAQIANGPREGKALLSDILTKAFSNSSTSGLQTLYQVSKAGYELVTKNFSQGLVLAFTKNDDSETLNEVLQLLRDANLSFEVSEASENPIVAASLASDIKCMRLLYKAGYRVRLAEKDWKLVKNLIKTPETRIPIRKKSETKRKLEDPVIRFLRFKAYANPLYLSLELAEGKLQRAGGGTTTSRKSFVFRDPIKKAFTLGQHAKSLV